MSITKVVLFDTKERQMRGMDAVDMQIDFERAISRLPSSERLSFALRHCGYTDRQQAELLHVTHQRIVALVKRATKRVKEAME